jgi:uncharacterized OsmC-like protein
MRIIMNSEEDLDIGDFTKPGINIESTAPDTHYSALQMFATSLALCTYSVLASYAEQIDVSSDNVAVHMAWSYAEEPFRIKQIDMEIDWPELPESRQAAARRAAAMCTIHNTLAHPPEITTRVNI